MAATEMMRAVAIDRFGGVEELRVRQVPVPEVGADEVLIRVETADVASWDPIEREGGYAKTIGVEPRFPLVLGSGGAGTVTAVGDQVRGITRGDRVCASGFLNPKGGFYAEYAAARAELTLPIPKGLRTEQAGVTLGVGLTALRGLEDTLHLRSGETLLVLGAGGGIGHVAVQLAKRMGARVLAVASGNDGVALARRLGADAVVNGREEDLSRAARAFAPDGLDAALLTAGGAVTEAVFGALRSGGRAAYPNSTEPVREAPRAVRVTAYNGDPDPDILRRLHARIESGPFDVHVAQRFSLDQAAEAHRALEKHYLGKLALNVAPAL
jgi:NADPH:quinone reductase-like Zn-dependent oxidoreductase